MDEWENTPADFMDFHEDWLRDKEENSRELQQKASASVYDDKHEQTKR